MRTLLASVLFLSSLCSAHSSEKQFLNNNVVLNTMFSKAPKLSVKPLALRVSNMRQSKAVLPNKKSQEVELEIERSYRSSSNSTGARFVKNTLGMTGMGIVIGSIAYFMSDKKWAVKPFMKYAGLGALIGTVLGAGCALADL